MLNHCRDFIIPPIHFIFHSNQIMDIFMLGLHMQRMGFDITMMTGF